MRVGLFQAPSPSGDLNAGLAVIESALARASGSGVEILVMPELFLPGYNAVTATPPEGWDAVMPRLTELCARSRVALAIGLPEYTKDAVYNSAFVIGPDGAQIAKYRKVQLYGAREKALFQAGDQLVTFDYRGMRFGLLVCYDVEFPEHTRALARAGASVLLVPTANMVPFINVCLIQIPGRALESGLTIVYANYCGSEGDLDYVGHSIIAGPDGYPLGSKGTGAGLVVAELPDGIGENGIPLSTQLADYRPAKPPA